MNYTPVDTILQTFQPVIGNDYEKYRNHVCRVFHNCVTIDPQKDNEEKYAVVAVFHDIGIWTNNTIDYLDPSIAQLNNYLTRAGRQQWMDECGRMIHWHHKPARYKGPYEQTVETFRKADWIDVSLGMLTYGIHTESLVQNRKELPTHGFHWFLVKKLVKNFFRHPFHPLPMFKW